MDRMTIVPAPVRAEIIVQATPALAFEVFTARIGRWWNPSFSIGNSPQKDISIEPKPGGRWFERGEDGSECDWGKVLVWEAPSRIVLGWQLGADFRYDPNLLTELEIRFVPAGKGQTKVVLEHRNLERFGDRADEVRGAIGSDQGWPGLLRRYQERVAALSGSESPWREQRGRG